MTERIRRKTTGNHRPHVKDERTTGPFSPIETSSTYSISKSTDLLSFYETLGYSTLLLILTCGPTKPCSAYRLPHRLSIHSHRCDIIPLPPAHPNTLGWAAFSFSMVVFYSDQCTSHFDFLSFPTTPISVPHVVDCFRPSSS